jgi:hypothetical protein
MVKKIVAPVVVGGALLFGVGTVGVANTAGAATPASKGQIKAWVKSHRQELRRAGLAISAKTIVITPQTLAADLKAGDSVAGVATEHNVSPQTVVNALVSAADTQINNAVTAGKLTSTEANNIETALPTFVTKAVDHTF